MNTFNTIPKRNYFSRILFLKVSIKTVVASICKYENGKLNLPNRRKYMEIQEKIKEEISIAIWLIFITTKVVE